MLSWFITMIDRVFISTYLKCPSQKSNMNGLMESLMVKTMKYFLLMGDL